MKAITKQNNRMQIDSMQLTMPRARRRHFYNLRYSGYVTLLVSGSDKTIRDRSLFIAGGGGSEYLGGGHMVF